MIDAAPQSADAVESSDSRNFVTAFARGLTVMAAFNGQNRPMTLSDIARVVDLPRATVRRCLLTMQALDYVETDGRYFSLSPQVLLLARAYLSSSILPRVAQPFLEQVSEATGESCSLSILHGTDVIYIARSGRRRMASLHRDVGTQLPAHCTSMGRVLLAALSAKELDAYFAIAKLEQYTPRTPTDRATLRKLIGIAADQGFCEIDQELEIGLVSIAVPVRNTSGKIVAAINVSGQAGRNTRKHLRGPMLSAIRQAAAEMRPLLIT